MTRFFTKTKLMLFAIILLAAGMRFYGVNWDQGYHLHPDERAIVLAVVKLFFPHTLSQFLSPESTWNPHFFAYGSFPMYALKWLGNIGSLFNPLLGQYDLITLVGRIMSGTLDLVTILFLFLIGKKVQDSALGLLSAFLYAISVLPIQLSHFYAVDTMLTCFCVITLYLLLTFYEHPSLKKAGGIGMFFGLALATKISALVLLSSIGLTLVVDFLLLLKRHHPEHWRRHVPPFFLHLLKYGLSILLIAGTVFLLCEPYAVLDQPEFTSQNLQQAAMTKSAFTFPYTLQYVGKIPYIYELKNMALWGLGPVLSLFVFGGFFYFLYSIFSTIRKERQAKKLIILVFFLIYFLIVGHFAVGFMRYMLPLYPWCALFGAMLLLSLGKEITRTPLRTGIGLLVTLLLLIWPMSFLHIYTVENTRVQATNWIHAHIPPGKTLAIEHWDDGMPLRGQEQYTIETLAMYDPDTAVKWQTIDAQLSKADYLIIASNRLYTPLMKLTNCLHLPPDRCYQQTALYYKELFSGQRGFSTVMEFTNYPQIPFLHIRINDQSADESFTVYDHPKVMLLKKGSET